MGHSCWHRQSIDPSRASLLQGAIDGKRVAMKPKSYVGSAKTKKLAELRSVGMPASAIAEQLDISVATVYRLGQAKKG